MAPAKQAPAAVSFRPSTFAQGGGLIDDVDITVTRARFGFGYGKDGGDGSDAVTFHMTMVDGDGAEHQQYYSVGNGFVPSEVGDDEENGKSLVPVADKTSVSASSNFAMAITSLVNAGFPEDLLDGDISKLEGLKAHVNRVPEPKRGGGIVRKESAYPKTVLVFTSILALPGEAPVAKKGPVAVAPKPGAATAAKSSVKTAATASPSEGSQYGDRIAEELVGIFAAEGVDELKKVQIVQKLFKAIPTTDPDRKAILADAGKDDVLAALDGFAFDGSTIKMA